jgi:hypothetical protein
LLTGRKTAVFCGDFGVVGQKAACFSEDDTVPRKRPFCGTGTTNLVAFQLGRKSVGIDLAERYVKMAEDRCRLLL